MAETRRFLCRLDELIDGESRGFDPFARGADLIFLVRQGSAVYAWMNVCPHTGGTLPRRKDLYLTPTKDQILCASHGATFEIATGRCTAGPCFGQFLGAVPIAIENGQVFLDG